MFRFDSFTWQAIFFSAGAFAIVGGLTWWLFFSPGPDQHNEVLAPSSRLINSIVSALGVSSGLMVVGALWDASMHIQTGQIPGGADFLWPPHLMIYGSFLISFMVAVLAITQVARIGWVSGSRDPRIWIRSNPYLGAVALSSLFTILSIPGDALWHELFGIDLTAWSPPHLLIALMSSAVLISAVGLLLQKRVLPKGRFYRDLAIFALLGLMLNILYIVGVLEWELPGVRSPHVNARPLWSYPMIGGSLAFFALMLAKRLTVQKWAATWTIIIFYLVRLGITVGLDITGNVVPYSPLPFVLGALLVDVVPWQRIPSNVIRALAVSTLFTFGYTLVAQPFLSERSDLFHFSPWDFVWTIVTTLLIALLLLPVTRVASRRLVGHQT